MNDKKKRNSVSQNTVSIPQLLKMLFGKLWLIIIAGLLCGIIAFFVSYFIIKPSYSATAILYVNNNISVSSSGISSSEISAAQSLVKTYIVILKNRTTLDQVIQNTQLNYSYKEVLPMISAAPVDNTEAFSVTVTCRDPNEAALLANGIASILPDRVSDIIEGSSMRLVDKAVADPTPVSPNTLRNTVFGVLIGVMISSIVFVIMFVLDDVIHDSSYLTQTFDIPILARIPDVTGHSSQSKYYSHEGEERIK